MYGAETIATAPINVAFGHEKTAGFGPPFLV
jgi:hypothetical protein